MGVVGGSVGGVLAVVVCVLAVLCRKRRRRIDQQAKRSVEAEQGKLAPLTSSFLPGSEGERS